MTGNQRIYSEAKEEFKNYQRIIEHHYNKQIPALARSVNIRYRVDVEPSQDSKSGGRT